MTSFLFKIISSKSEIARLSKLDSTFYFLIKYLILKSTLKWKVVRKISLKQALYNLYFYENQSFFKANFVIRTKCKHNSFVQDYTAENSDFFQVAF